MTERHSPWRRLPTRSLAAVYAEQVAPTSALVVALLLARHSDVGGARWAGPLFAVLLAARLIAPLYTWTALKFDVVTDGLWVATGVVHRRRRFTPWRAVAAVEVDRPWSHRLFGVARLTLRQGGDDATPTVLPGVDTALARELASRARVPKPQDAAVEAAEAAEATVYRSSAVDLLMAGLIYGKFATFGAAAALGAFDLLNRLPLTDGVRDLAAAGPFVVAPVVALCILVAGAVTMVLRFGGLETVQRGDGVLIRYGLLSTRERMVAADAVIGVELRRNLVEMALGRVRLTLITLDSATRLGSNLVLPSLRERDAARVVAAPASFGLLEEIRLPGSRLSTLAGSAAALLVLLSSAAACSFVAFQALDGRRVWAALVFVLVLLLLHWAGSTALARLRLDRDAASVTLTTAFVSHREVTLHLPYVHLVSAVHLRRRSMLVRLHYFAGLPRALTAVRYDPVDWQFMSEAIVRAPRGGRLS